MPFSARNARYLRISAHTVLPLYIYLDDRHIEWMSDSVLHRVLADLRPHIGPKLRTESSIHGTGGSANAKKGSVEVHRGDTYQFAYFFRKNDPHAVLIKSRRFVPAAEPPPTNVPPTETQLPKPNQQKRKHGGLAKKPARTNSGRRQGANTRKKRSALSDIEEDSMDGSGEDVNSVNEGDEPRRSRRKRKLVAGGYGEATDPETGDAEMNDPDSQRIEARDFATGRCTPPSDEMNGTQVAQDEADGNTGESSQPSQPLAQSEIESGPGVSHIFDVDAEQEEEKPKLSMRLSYKGFSIYDRCLCIVIEPWPSRDLTRALIRAPSLASIETRMSSVAPKDHHDRISVPLRERTPLFLPEIDPRRSLTPAPLPSRILPPIPLFEDSTEPDDSVEETEGGMLAFTQVLNSAGGERAGNADEDGYDGDVFGE